MGEQINDIGENWIANASKTIAKEPVVERKEAGNLVLKEVAKRAGISEEKYLQLVGGEIGEVPVEFEEAAREAINEVLNLPLIVQITNDRDAFEEIINQLKRDGNGFPHSTIDSVSELLLSNAEEDMANEIGQLKIDKKKQLELSEYITKESIKRLDDNFDEIESLDRKNKLEIVFAQTAEKIADGNVLNIIEIQPYSNDPAEVKKQLDLHKDFAKLNITRFADGKSTFLKSGDSYDKKYTSDVKLGLDTTNSLNEVIDLYDKSIVESITQKTIKSVQELIISKVSLVQTGLIEGAMLSGTVIGSKLGFEKAIKRFNQELSIDPVVDRPHTPPSQEAISMYSDNLHAGYILGSLDKLDPNSLELVSSLKLSLCLIVNPELKAFVINKLTALKTESQFRNMLEVVIDLPPKENEPEELKSMREFVKKIEIEMQRRSVLESLYEGEGNNNSIFIGSQLAFEEAPTRNQSIGEYSNFKDKLKTNLIKREVTFDTLRRIVGFDAERSVPPISWNDVEIVLEKMKIHAHGVKDKNRLEDILKENELSANQKRLIVMTRLISVASGSTTESVNIIEQFAIEAQKFVDLGLIFENDIVDAYNSLALSIHQISKTNEFKKYDLYTQPVNISPVMDQFNYRQKKSGIFNDNTGLPLFNGKEIVNGQGKGARIILFSTKNIGSDSLHFVVDDRLLYDTGSKEQQAKLDSIDNAVDLLASQRIPNEQFSSILQYGYNSVGEIKINWFDRSYASVEDLALKNGWNLEVVRKMETELDVVEKAITPPDGIITKLEDELSTSLSHANPILNELDRLKTSLERLVVPKVLGFKSPISAVDRERKAIAQTSFNTIKENIKSLLSVDDKDLLKLDLSNEKTFERVKSQVLAVIQMKSNKLKEEYEKVEKQVDITADLTQLVVEKSIPDNGMINGKTNIMDLNIPERTSITSYIDKSNARELVIETALTTMPYTKVSAAHEKFIKDSNQRLAVTNSALDGFVKSMKESRDKIGKQIETKSSPEQARMKLQTRLVAVYKAVAHDLQERKNDITNAFKKNLPQNKASLILSRLAV